MSLHEPLHPLSSCFCEFAQATLSLVLTLLWVHEPLLLVKLPPSPHLLEQRIPDTPPSTAYCTGVKALQGRQCPSYPLSSRPRTDHRQGGSRERWGRREDRRRVRPNPRRQGGKRAFQGPTGPKVSRGMNSSIRTLVFLPGDVATEQRLCHLPREARQGPPPSAKHSQETGPSPTGLNHECVTTDRCDWRPQSHSRRFCRQEQPKASPGVRRSPWGFLRDAEVGGLKPDSTWFLKTMSKWWDF